MPDATVVSDTPSSLSGGGTTISGLTSHNSSSRQSDDSGIRRDREREGRCPECGAQTHEVLLDRHTSSAIRKMPLNIPGEVHRGRCLLCKPLGMQHRVSQHQQHHFDDLESIQSEDLSHYASRQDHHAPENVRSCNSIDGERNRGHVPREHTRRVAPSDGSVRSAHSYHSAPEFSGRNNMGSERSQASFPLPHQRAPMLGLNPSYGHPPLEELTVRPSSRGGNSHRSQPQDQRPDTVGSGASISSNLDNLAIREDQTQVLPRLQPAIQELIQDHSQAAANIREILSSMQRYPNHVTTQSKGMHSLWVLSWDDVNASTVGQMGGIPILFDSMRTHVDTVTLISNAVSCIQNLAMVQSNWELLLSNGVVELIADIMGHYVSDKAMQQNGCQVYANLANGPTAQKSYVAEKGGILAMMRAVNTHRGDESILRAAYQALRKLGYNPG